MRLTTCLAVGLGVFAVVVSGVVQAQLTEGVPSENVNVIGPTPGEPPPFTPSNPLFFPDTGIRQQNEPSCGIKPGSPLEVICAFNDYRGAGRPAGR